MPSLNELLEHTMVFVAALGRHKRPTEGAPTFTKPKVRPKDEEIDDLEAGRMPIWHFDVDSDPAKVKNLTCLSRGMGNARMGVCDEISFGSVEVTLPGGSSRKLNLEKKFLYKSYSLDGGLIEPKGDVWFKYPLWMFVDKAFLHAFVFEFPDGKGTEPVPTKQSLADSADFMPRPLAPGQAQVPSGATTRAVIDSFRVVVFVSLVTCMEKADFEPGGILGGARLIPHVMIIGNRPIQEVKASVTVQRPAVHSMLEGGDHALCAEMNPGIESALFADDNDAPKKPVVDAPLPDWDVLFAATEAPAKFQSYVVVDPKKKERTLSGVVGRLDLDFVVSGSTPARYLPKKIRRVARQGAFDNVHTAPTMKIDDFRPKGVPASIFEKVYMAPFCQHDCLHTHWRWGSFTDKLQNRGWSTPPSPSKDSPPHFFPGRPYSTVGAPMVPFNQKVTLDLLSATSYRYSVVAGGADFDPIPAGTCTFVNHHGSGYAIKVVGGVSVWSAGTGTSFGSALSPNEEVPDTERDDAKFYWLLRYALTDNGVFDTTTSAWERLKKLEIPVQMDDTKTAYERLVVLAGARNRLLSE